MAKVVSQTLVITFSKLVKDNHESSVIAEDVQSSLEQVAQELVGESVIVEIEQVS